MKKVLFLFLFLFLVCPILVFAEQIDINSASLAQIDEIVHVGSKVAQKIIDDRPYGSVQDLSRVKGIGNGKYLQDIIAQGFACVNCVTEVAQTPTNTDITQTPDTQSPTPATAAMAYPSGVYINEILPNPAGPDELDEWVELYNSNSSDVDLSGWQLQDTTGTITNYTIPAGTKILAGSFLVFKRPDTDIMLNNDKDGLNLISLDKNIADSVSFASAPLGQSYSKSLAGWAWSTTATPGSKNAITVAVAKSLSKAKNSVKNDVVVADLSQSINPNQDSKNLNPWFLFFIVLAVTIILATVVLIIKLKIFKNHVRT